MSRSKTSRRNFQSKSELKVADEISKEEKKPKAKPVRKFSSTLAGPSSGCLSMKSSQETQRKPSKNEDYQFEVEVEDFIRSDAENTLSVSPRLPIECNVKIEQQCGHTICSGEIDSSKLDPSPGATNKHNQPDNSRQKRVSDLTNSNSNNKNNDKNNGINSNNCIQNNSDNKNNISANINGNIANNNQEDFYSNTSTTKTPEISANGQNKELKTGLLETNSFNIDHVSNVFGTPCRLLNRSQDSVAIPFLTSPHPPSSPNTVNNQSLLLQKKQQFEPFHVDHDSRRHISSPDLSEEEEEIKALCFTKYKSTESLLLKGKLPSSPTTIPTKINSIGSSTSSSNPHQLQTFVNIITNYSQYEQQNSQHFQPRKQQHHKQHQQQHQEQERQQQPKLLKHAQNNNVVSDSMKQPTSPKNHPPKIQRKNKKIYSEFHLKNKIQRSKSMEPTLNKESGKERRTREGSLYLDLLEGQASKNFQCTPPQPPNNNRRCSFLVSYQNNMEHPGREYLETRRQTVAVSNGIKCQATVNSSRIPYEKWLQIKAAEQRRKSISIANLKELEKLREQQVRQERFGNARPFEKWKEQKDEELKIKQSNEREQEKQLQLQQMERQRTHRELKEKKYKEWLEKKFEQELAEEQRKIKEIRNYDLDKNKSRLK